MKTFFRAGNRLNSQQNNYKRIIIQKKVQKQNTFWNQEVRQIEQGHEADIGCYIQVIEITKLVVFTSRFINYN